MTYRTLAGVTILLSITSQLAHAQAGPARRVDQLLLCLDRFRQDVRFEVDLRIAKLKRGSKDFASLDGLLRSTSRNAQAILLARGLPVQVLARMPRNKVMAGRLKVTEKGKSFSQDPLDPEKPGAAFAAATQDGTWFLCYVQDQALIYLEKQGRATHWTMGQLLMPVPARRTQAKLVRSGPAWSAREIADGKIVYTGARGSATYTILCEEDRKQVRVLAGALHSKKYGLLHIAYFDYEKSTWGGWPNAVLRLTRRGTDEVKIVHSRLRKVDVGSPKSTDINVRVLAGARIVDLRNGRGGWGKDPDSWPKDVRSLVRVVNRKRPRVGK